MSKHSIELPSITPAGWAVVTVGYTVSTKGPHFFCQVIDSIAPMIKMLWNSMFAEGYQFVTDPDGFDNILANWGLVLPPFIKQALREDWVKEQVSCEYFWKEDGEFNQIF